MNIFYVDSDPWEAARCLADKHVVKMILESCQLLSTAHRVLDGVNNVLPDEREKVLYKATHANHPCAVWVRESWDNYYWLSDHTSALLWEYTYRYNKRHKSTNLISYLRMPPESIPAVRGTMARLCVPDEFKVPGDPVASYRNYYNIGKRSLHKWTRRERPSWITEEVTA